MRLLEVTIGELTFRNPTMLASGIMDETAGSLLNVARAGAGAVVTKSIGSEPRKGYANPTMVELDEGYINAMGLPNPGIEAFAEEMRQARSCPVPVIGSVFASSPKEFSFLASKMQDYGAAAVELNLSCPHAKGYGMEIGVDPEAVTAVVREVKSACSIPVFAKLTPNTRQLLDVAQAVEAAGADGIVAINTVKAMAISVEMRRPILSNRVGGLSGPAIKPIGLRCVYDLHSEVNIPIIGVGGIEDWRDAVEYIMAGASAVQVGSGVGRIGLNVFESICSGMRDFMGREGFTSVGQMVGAAHE
ncbi:MAG: dihydroorotate dehydrogenase [Methanomassiliicoccales archaeon]|nr:dihydroorotate dehydrogenase [Methanomassiliicoccales archaeon]